MIARAFMTCQHFAQRRNQFSQRSLNIRIRLSGIQCISRFCDCVRVLHRSFEQPLVNLALRRLEVLIDHRQICNVFSFKQLEFE